MFTLKLCQLRALFGTKRQTLIVLFHTLNNVKFALFVRRRIGTRSPLIPQDLVALLISRPTSLFNIRYTELARSLLT